MESNENTFITERLPLATYLHASRKLSFSHCENGGPDKIRFVFVDPDAAGDDLELEFENGAAVAATSLFASQKFLRRKMTDTINLKRSNGHAYHNRR